MMHGHTYIKIYEMLEMKVIRSFETSEVAFRLTQCHIISCIETSKFSYSRREGWSFWTKRYQACLGFSSQLRVVHNTIIKNLADESYMFDKDLT